MYSKFKTDFNHLQQERAWVAGPVAAAALRRGPDRPLLAVGPGRAAQSGRPLPGPLQRRHAALRHRRLPPRRLRLPLRQRRRTGARLARLHQGPQRMVPPGQPEFRLRHDQHGPLRGRPRRHRPRHLRAGNSKYTVNMSHHISIFLLQI